MVGTGQFELLDWNRPALPAAAEWIVGRLADGGVLDLSDWIVVLPTGRSRRRLLQLLARHCQAAKMVFRPGDFLTVGQLPEKLYQNRLPFAGGIESRLAWSAALADLSPADRGRLFPGLDPRDLRARDETAELLLGLHERLGADGWSFSSVWREVQQIGGFPEPDRWGILARIQKACYRRLEEQGLWDRQAARNVAARGERDRCQTGRRILLVAIADLNQILRRMLEQVAGKVTALAWGDDSVRGGFDSFGALVPGFWAAHPVDLPDEAIRVVDRPIDQADAVVGFLEDLPGEYATDEISVCAPDDEVAILIRRLLEMREIPTRRLDGSDLAQFSVGQLIAGIVEWLRRGTFVELSALVRHPDVFAWLSREIGQCQWLEDFDSFQNRFLPGAVDLGKLGPVGLPAEPAAIGSEGRIPRLMALLNRLLGPLAGGGAGDSGNGSKALPEGDSGGIRPERKKQRSQRAGGDSADRPLFPEISGEPPIGAGRSQSGLESAVAAWGHVLQTVYGTRELDLQQQGDRLTAAGLSAATSVLLDLAALGDPWASCLDPAGIGGHLLRAIGGESLSDSEEAGAVELVGWLDLPLDDARAVVVTGFNGHHFPSSQRGHFLLPDSLCRQLGLQDNARRYARDAWILSMAVRGGRVVRLVAGRRDSQNSPLLPSRLMFAAGPETVLRRAKAFFECEGSPFQRRWMRAGQAAAIRQSLAVPRPVPVPPIGRISVTRIRDFLKCPYRFYLSAVLNLTEVSDDARELDGGAFGDLAHQVLEEFGNSDVANSGDEEVIAGFLSRTLAKLKKRWLPWPALPAAEIQVANLEKRLRRFAAIQAERRRAGWQIVRVEPKVELPVMIDGQPFVVVGKIDRVDRHSDGRLAVWDYKTSDTGKTAEQAHRRQGEWTDFQLPLYRHLLTQVLEEAGKQVDTIGLGYVLLPRDLQGIRFDEVKWEAGELHEADRLAKDAMRKIRAQQFWPPAESAPEYSEVFAAICQDQVFERWVEPVAEAAGPGMRGGGNGDG